MRLQEELRQFTRLKEGLEVQPYWENLTIWDNNNLPLIETPDASEVLIPFIFGWIPEGYGSAPQRSYIP